jgi:hypothetical protein
MAASLFGSVQRTEFSLNSCAIKPSRIILGARIDQPSQAAITELAEKIFCSSD